MKTFFLTVVLFILIITISAGAVGCSQNDVQDNVLNNQQNSSTTDVSSLNNTNPGGLEAGDLNSMDYTLLEEAGVHYIVFDDILPYLNLSGGQMKATVDFGSLAEFKDSVTNGKLTVWQKHTIATSFPRDENDKILVCDFNKLIEPQMPKDFKIDGVSWEGEGYAFLVSTSSEVFGTIQVFSQDEYSEFFEKNFENYFDKTTITVTGTYKTDDGKTVTTYFTSRAELMQIRYIYSIGDKTIVVDEEYWLSMADESLTTSDSVPKRIKLYCAEPNAYYVVNLYGFVEKPSDAWICDFGMKPYVHLNVADK